MLTLFQILFSSRRLKRKSRESIKYNAKEHKRRSIRLKGYDYLQQGMYFVTVCTHDKKCNLGKVINDEMQLNKYGHIVEEEWFKTTDIRNNVELDSYVIMPNHFHGIVIINCRGERFFAPYIYNIKLLKPHA